VSLLRALAGHFLVLDHRPAAASPHEGSRCEVPRAAAPAAPQRVLAPTVALLCAPRDALPVGGALALAVSGGRGVAVVGLWTGGLGVNARRAAPALPAARRLATSLAARATVARATGRLVVVDLPGGEADAVSSWDRVRAAAEAPCVLVLAAARGELLDGLLAAQDLVVVAAAGRRGREEPLVRLAAVAARRMGARVATCPVPEGPERLAGAAGLDLPTPLRRALVAALETA
jgi:hypothetical protein